MLKYPRDYSKFLGRVKSIDGRSDFRPLLNNGVNFIDDYDDNGGFFLKKKWPEGHYKQLRTVRYT